MKRAALVVAIVACGMLVSAPVAAASWATQTTPNLAAGTTGVFNAVSCGGANSFCMAVGTFTNAGQTGLLAMTRSGQTWSFDTPPNVTGSGENLTGVSCPSTTRCVIVGSYVSGSDEFTLAEVWSGPSSWAVSSTPNPSGATTAVLNDVYCTSTTSCVAVGYWSTGTGSNALVETWNGSSWTIQSTPGISGGSSIQLNGVSCSTANACTAVGSYNNGTDTVTLAERWSGSSWTVQSTPNPSGFTSSTLNGVSCSGSTVCTAVGDGFAEQWNGSGWTLQTVPKPPQSTSGGPDLSRVWCKSATVCTAVGGYYQDAVFQAVAERWNGSTWSSQSTPISASYDTSGFAAVWCGGPTTCTAVGWYHDPVDGDFPLVEVEALHWQLQTAVAPSDSISSSLSGVACVTVNVCHAVGGDETNTSSFDSFDESWNGGSWTLQTVADPSTTGLNAVACSSKSACTSVGYFYNGTNDVPFVERWNGSSWAAQTTPVPAGATLAVLNGVSCPSATACTAVGYYKTAGGQFSLAMAWDGTTWNIQTTPNPTGQAGPEFNSVSCTSATACTAVGSANTGSSVMLAERWNGSTWTIQNPPLPSGGSDTYLASVSCTGSPFTGCTAVGSYFNGSKQVPLAERWNGTAWSVQSAVAPTASTSSLSSVSCLASGICNAVGSYFNPHSSGFAEYYNGQTWSQRVVVKPPSSQGFTLTGIDCPSVYGCEAVGWLVDSIGNDEVLAEQES